MSRSATIVVSYIMKKFPEMTTEKALKFVKNKRPIVSPNDGFLRQLKSYEKILFKARVAEKPITKMVQESPKKNENKYEISSPPQVVDKKPEEVKNSLSVTRNYHYARGVSETANNRVK